MSTIKIADALAGILPADLPVRVTAYDGSAAGPADAPIGLELRTERGLRYLLTAPGDLGMARAWVAGDLTGTGFHPGNLYPLLDLMSSTDRWRVPGPAEALELVRGLGWEHLNPPPPPPQEHLPRWRRVVEGLRHSRARDAEVIHHHYDVSTRFYELVLGPSMTYTCAVYPTAEATLEQAQEHKYELIARKLDLVDDELAGEQFAILGDSFGGMVARAVAHRRRDRVLGLGLLASVFVADASARVVPERVVLHEDTDAVAVAGDSADDYADIAVVQTRGNAEAFVEFAAPGAELADGEAMKKLSENYRLSWDPEDSEPFTQPSLIITGRQDHIVGYRDALNRLEHYPRATFVTLDEAGHNAHLDQDALVGALVADWLRRMRPYDKR